MELNNQKSSLIIVLVEPSGPINLGSVARLCANFNVDELRAVSPTCNSNDPNAQKMSVKGKRFLNEMKIFNSLIEALEDCHKVIATCGRIDHGSIPLETPEEAINWLSQYSNLQRIALVFGREDRGLTNEELLLAHKVISINSSSHYPSLNISHSVGILLYELRKKQNKQNNLLDVNTDSMSTPKQLNDFIIDTKELLIEVGFLLSHTAKARMSKIKSLLNRAEITSEEVSLLRGIVRQVRWAIRSRRS